MSKEEFSELKENEGWEEDDDDEEKISMALSYEGLPEIKAPWKRIIHEAAHLTLRSYRGWQEEGLDRDKGLMEDKAAFAKLSRREQNALQVRYGQKIILCRLMEVTLGHGP